MDKFICIGKNYLEHAKELGDAVPEKPVLFLKPPSAGVFCEKNNSTLTVSLPKGQGSVHPECELIIRLGAKMEVEAVSMGLDLTLRDLQSKLKKEGHPWEISKAFPSSAVVGPWILAKDFSEFENSEFTFSVNGKIRQKAKPSEMRLSVAECIEHARSHFTLCEGDIIFTGTPAGVSAVNAGDCSEINFGKIKFSVEWK